MPSNKRVPTSKADRKIKSETNRDIGESKATQRATRTRTPIVKRAVLDAAADIFSIKGFAGTNLRDIANALGMSRPGLYYHFSSKEAILEALVEEVTLAGERYVKQLNKSGSSSAEQSLRQTVELGTIWVIDHARLFRIVDRSENELDPEMYERNVVAKREIRDNLRDIIERGVSQGVFRPIDAEVAAFALIGMQNWAAWWFREEGRRSSDEVAHTFADMAVRSLIRSDVHRTRSEQVHDVLRVLEEDVAHLRRILSELPGTESR